jgi:hypothetical protein
MEKKQSTEGDPMFVESLMTVQEWRERMRKYKTSLSYEEGHKLKPNLFKWRYRMGQGFPLSEIKLFNERLDTLLKTAKLSV